MAAATQLPLVYCLSGLGADKRVFSRLRFEAEIRHVQWLQPQPHESLTHYAGRMAAQVDSSRPFILLGVSFGGIVAQELCRYLQPQKTIIISSVTQPQQLPRMYRLRPLAYVLKLLPDKALVTPNMLAAYIFGVAGADEKRLLYRIIRESDPGFVRWALRVLIQLKIIFPVSNLLHLHGNRDRLIPVPKASKGLSIVQGGGHFMIVNKAAKVSVYINKMLKQL